MFIFDVETLGKESNSVILSMAAIYFDTTKTPSHTELRDSAFFVKFDVEDQIVYSAGIALLMTTGAIHIFENYIVTAIHKM